MVDLPVGKEAIGLRWIFKSKFNPNGTLHKHKARVVVKDYVQISGIDFSEIFATVIRFDIVRTILALTAYYDWPVYQLDIKSAFLNGELDEDVYMEQPQGFEVKGVEHKVYKLQKALYGLKQAPRA